MFKLLFLVPMALATFSFPGHWLREVALDPLRNTCSSTHSFGGADLQYPFQHRLSKVWIYLYLFIPFFFIHISPICCSSELWKWRCFLCNLIPPAAVLLVGKVDLPESDQWDLLIYWAVLIPMTESLYSVVKHCNELLYNWKLGFDALEFNSVPL